jgi:hypothetical protein
MADLRQGIVIILRECLDLPRNGVTEIQEHAQRFLASIKAGDSPDALRMQAARIQMALGDVVDDAGAETWSHARAPWWPKIQTKTGGIGDT